MYVALKKISFPNASSQTQDGNIPMPQHIQSILHISGCGRSLKTARRSKPFSCASRIYWLFIFGGGTRASGATTAIPRTSDIVPKFGWCRAILHISGCGRSLKTARRSKSFFCALRIYQLRSFGAGRGASGATTATPSGSTLS